MSNVDIVPDMLCMVISMPLLFSTCVMISDSIVPNDITNIIALANTISDMIHVVLTSNGIDHTAEDLAGRMTTLTFIHDREHDEETPDEPEALRDLFFDCIEALYIDPDHILH